MKRDAGSRPRAGAAGAAAPIAEAGGRPTTGGSGSGDYSLNTLSHNGRRGPDSRRAQLPSPSDRRIALRVSPAAERAIRGGHPWLFAGAIRRQSHQGRPGDLAVIFDRKGRFLAVGLYDPTAPIRVRVLQADRTVPINQDWFRDRLAAAVARRQPLVEAGHTGYRLVHGENDGLPGLVVDRYADTAVLKLDTPAWLPHLNPLLDALAQVVAPDRAVLRLSRSVQQLDDGLHGLKDGVVLSGPPLSDSILFREHGFLFEADVRQGQKTGFFLDQRDNRAQVESLASGRQVLNVFAYSGGFSLYAARGGATGVVSLDISQPALAAALRNFRLNREQPGVAGVAHELLLGDAFRTLRQLRRSGRRFDLVVVDPPAFARRRAERPRALSAYGRLTRLALGVLRRDGILVMASCSSRVAAAPFFAAVHQAAAGVNRPLRELARTYHPLDHPIGFPDGAYLKCLFAAV